jgi:hypothetical protein
LVSIPRRHNKNYYKSFKPSNSSTISAKRTGYLANKPNGISANRQTTPSHNKQMAKGGGSFKSNNSTQRHKTKPPTNSNPIGNNIFAPTSKRQKAEDGETGGEEMVELSHQDRRRAYLLLVGWQEFNGASRETAYLNYHTINAIIHKPMLCT